MTWAAVVFAVFGLIAVLLDRDPIPRGVSPYFGLLALAAAGVIVWITVARSTLARTPWLAAVSGGALVYLLLVLSGATDGLGLIASQATSVFVLTAAGLAVLTVVASWYGIRAARRGPAGTRR